MKHLIIKMNLDNKIYQFDTIVEMIYIKENIWKILRTINDKTYYMLNNNSKYGNHVSIANNNR